MWYSPTFSAATELVTLAEVKAHCRIDASDDDALLNDYIAAARCQLEDQYGVILSTRTATVKCDSWDDLEDFPISPLADVASISYVDAANAAQTLSTAFYEVVPGSRGRVDLKYGKSWPAIYPQSKITVVASVGGSVSPPAKHATKMLVELWYDSRAAEAAAATMGAIRSLMMNYISRI